MSAYKVLSIISSHPCNAWGDLPPFLWCIWLLFRNGLPDFCFDVFVRSVDGFVWCEIVCPWAYLLMAMAYSCRLIDLSWVASLLITSFLFHTSICWIDRALNASIFIPFNYQSPCSRGIKFLSIDVNILSSVQVGKALQASWFCSLLHCRCVSFSWLFTSFRIIVTWCKSLALNMRGYFAAKMFVRRAVGLSKVISPYGLLIELD